MPQPESVRQQSAPFVRGRGRPQWMKIDLPFGGLNSDRVVAKGEQTCDGRLFPSAGDRSNIEMAPFPFDTILSRDVTLLPPKSFCSTAGYPGSLQIVPQAQTAVDAPRSTQKGGE